jgi:hypothetical protein
MSGKNKKPFDFDIDEWEEELRKELEMTEQDKDLAKVTGFVSKNYGPKNALIFYIDYIQPIKQRLEELKNGKEDSAGRADMFREDLPSKEA